MIVRVLAVVVVVAGLLAAIFYSQQRPESNWVSGFVEADEIRLGSRVGGRVAKVLVQEGDEVTAGQVLIELEPFDALERREQAARLLAEKEAEYQRLQAGLRPQEVAGAEAHYRQLKAKLALLQAGPRDEEIRAAEARLEAATAEQELAQRQHQRQLELAQNNATTTEEVERARQRFESATATATVRQNELRLLQLGSRAEEIQAAEAAADESKLAWEMARVGFREEDIERARAARDAAAAALDAIDRQIDELQIKSPLAGVVDSLDLRPGDMVAGGAPVLSIVDPTRLWIRAYVPQNRVALQVGQQLDVGIDSFPDEIFTGTVTFIARQSEFTPSNVQTPEEREKQVYRIKVRLDEADDRLRPGMTADISLDPRKQDS